MADFHTSSHRAKWISSPRELVEKYKSVNQRAIQTLEKYGTTQMGVDAEGSISYPEPIPRDNADKRPKPLNIEQEQFMRVFYENKLREDLQETARLEVDKIMLTDAPHLFPPGQLALAALRSANEMHRVLDFEGYLRSLLARQNSENSVLLFIESLNAIDVWVRKYKFPTEKDMRHINRKLKSCLGHDDKKQEKKKHKSHKSSNEA